MRATGPGKGRKLKRPLSFLIYNFDVDGNQLKAEHEAFLRANAVNILRSGGSVSLYGLADRTGSDGHNQTLSEQRMENALAFLRRESPNGFQVAVKKGRGESVAKAKGQPDGSEDEDFRSVLLVFSEDPTPPDLDDDPPPPPAPARVGQFKVELFGWIPQPEVDNPLAMFPDVVKSLLPKGMADPFFGGDNFATPSSKSAGWSGKTFRGRQSVVFDVSSWGEQPIVGGVSIEPGTTTCLNARRAAGGQVTFSMRATVLSSSAEVKFSSFGDCYEIFLSAAIQDPIPAAAAGELTAKLAKIPPALRPVTSGRIQELASKATPTLTWKATVRIQKGSTVHPIFLASYAAFIGEENSGALSGATGAIGPGSNLVHGKVTFSIWPSAVIYLTFTPPGGSSGEEPVFFADGSKATKPETLKILIPKLAEIRRVKW